MTRLDSETIIEEVLKNLTETEILRIHLHVSPSLTFTVGRQAIVQVCAGDPSDIEVYVYENLQTRMYPYALSAFGIRR